MQTFKDKQGREWPLDIKISDAERLLQLSGNSLFEIDITKVGADPSRFLNVIYCLIKPALDEKGISDREFGDGMCFPGVWEARDAMVKEIILFFRLFRPEMADVLEKAWEKVNGADKALQPLLIAQANSQLDKLSTAEVVELVQRSMGGASSTNSPASLESNPAA